MSKNLNANNNDDDISNNINMLGVSVHWLKTGFLNEVKAAGLTDESKIYEIENLNGQPGVIRNKGKDAISPIDGRKGAAYVHCLKGDDNVGPATAMLSYTWGYTIGMIIQTLDDWCKSKGKDPKRTYLWICCLCVNQHRVVEQSELEKSGMVPTTPSVNFFDEFGHRVKSIGTILALMEPWESPKYLTRIWCVFEVYWATVHNCNVEIIMPQEQKDLMTNSILCNIDHDSKEKTGTDKLYDVLSNIDIEKADASVEEDKVKILEMIRNDGGYTGLNNIVNELFRSWVRKTIDELVLQQSNEINNIGDNKNSTTTNKSNLESYGNLCNNVGEIFMRNGEYDESLIMYKKCLDVRLNLYGDNHEKIASIYNGIGLVLMNKGDYDKALIQYENALTIQLSNLGEGHAYVATTYQNIGSVLMNKGDYDKALIKYEKALKIQLTKLGEDHPEVATTYNNIGLLLYNKGDYDNALTKYKKALTMCKSKFGEDHPYVATSYNNIGSVLKDKGDYNNAIIQYEKALTIYKSKFGEDHPEVATSYNNIGLLLYNKGDYDNALVQYEKALPIYKSKLGEDHPFVAASYNNIATVLRIKGDYDDALIQYEKALTMCKSKLGEDHPFVAASYNNIATVLKDKGDYDDALIHYEKALKIQLSKLGGDHPDIATTHINIGCVLWNKGDYDNALIQFNKSLDVQIKVFGEDHQKTKDGLRLIEIVSEEKRKKQQRNTTM